MSRWLGIFLYGSLLLPPGFQAFGKASHDSSDLMAIDILLAPDAGMEARAKVANARLRSDYPKGFTLDATHIAHLTILQLFVPVRDLARVKAAVTEVLKDEDPLSWEFTATGYDDIPVATLGLVGILVEPSSSLRRLQQKLIAAVTPFASASGDAQAFAPRLDGQPIAAAQQSIAYVATFASEHSGRRYRPHITVGLGTRAFVDRMKREPFEPVVFRAGTVVIDRVGEFGTASPVPGLDGTIGIREQ